MEHTINTHGDDDNTVEVSTASANYGCAIIVIAICLTIVACTVAPLYFAAQSESTKCEQVQR